jgi:PAS domain S-box-containing protein
LLSAVSAEILELQAGRRGFAYLVDGTGRVIYHRNNSLLNQDLTGIAPVARVIQGEAGSVVTDDSSGHEVVSGFAPVEGIGWGVITQERWTDVVGPIRTAIRLLLGLLAAGGLLTTLIVFIGIGRVLTPIKNVTVGARRIAEGDFGHNIDAHSGDEIQDLAEQFNNMAGTLQESYASLEQRVTDSTEDLRQTNQVLQGLIHSSPLPIMSIDRDARVQMWNPASERVFGWTEEEVIGKPLPSVPADQQDEFRSQLEPAWRGETFAGLEVIRQRKDGSLIDVGIWSAPLQDAEGEITGVMSIVSDLTEQKQAEQTLQELAVLGERNRLARELHDVLGHTLNLVVIQAGAAQRVFDSSPEKALEAVKSIESNGRQALSDVDRMLGILRESEQAAQTAPSLEVRPSMSRLNPLVEELTATGQSVELVISGTPAPLPPSIDLSAYRVVQEALTNVMTHAAGAKTHVAVEYSEQLLTVTVTNDSSGVDTLSDRTSGGRGIVGMRERTALFGGEFQAASIDGGGWRVHATFPTGESEGGR